MLSVSRTLMTFWHVTFDAVVRYSIEPKWRAAQPKHKKKRENADHFHAENEPWYIYKRMRRERIYGGSKWWNIRAGRLSRNKKKINTQPVEVCVYTFLDRQLCHIYINAELENCNRICTGPFVARLFYFIFWRGFQTR